MLINIYLNMSLQFTLSDNDDACWDNWDEMTSTRSLVPNRLSKIVRMRGNPVTWTNSCHDHVTCESKMLTFLCCATFVNSCSK